MNCINRPSPNQVFVLGLAIGLSPWFFSLFSEFALGGGFGFFAANATLAVTIAYYAGSNLHEKSSSVTFSLVIFGLFVFFTVLYLFLFVRELVLGLGFVLTGSLLLCVSYAFRQNPEDKNVEDGSNTR